MESMQTGSVPAHNIFTFDGVIFSSNFDNGNLARVEKIPNKSYEFKIWTAPDNMGTEFQSRHCAWFHFTVTGLPMGCVLRIQIVNATNHSALYRYDMRPVYRSNGTNQKWTRIKSSVRVSKDTTEVTQMYFEHSVDLANDKLSFAFTYPYTYSALQQDLAILDNHQNDMKTTGSMYYQRELLTYSGDKRRVDLITISSVDGACLTQNEPLLSGLFPESRMSTERPYLFPDKEVIFVSARVHPGEVPGQHTFNGILQLLVDPNDLCAKELRARYVFKLIPMLNPDGVFRGHFRMDQYGQNLNRYYVNPEVSLQPSIFGAKSLLDYYAQQTNKLTLYLDYHAHASKRGCFIYGNVLENLEDQIQNQLFCKLISLNSAHFDYEGCLFSKEHMYRTDPGDQAKGLTAEGSGRVATYLSYGLVHSYTIECNYNTSRVSNEVAPPDHDLLGSQVTLPSSFSTNPEKYTPTVLAGVGRACVIAFLDLRGHNPCSRITKSKFKTLDRVRQAVAMEVKNRKDFQGKQSTSNNSNSSNTGVMKERRKSKANGSFTAEDLAYKRIVDPGDCNANHNNSNNNTPMRQASPASTTTSNSSNSSNNNNPGVIFISSARDRKPRRATTSTSLFSSQSAKENTGVPPSKSNGSYVRSTIEDSQILSCKYVLEPTVAAAATSSIPPASSVASKAHGYFPAITSSGIAGICLSSSSKSMNGDAEPPPPQRCLQRPLPVASLSSRPTTATNSSPQTTNQIYQIQTQSQATTTVTTTATTTSPSSYADDAEIMLPNFQNHNQNADSIGMAMNYPSGLQQSNMRDIIREQSIKKMIRLSNLPPPLSSTTAPSSSRDATPTTTTNATATTNLLPPTSANTARRPPPPLLRGNSSNGTGSFKDNRKILGKTLHAAGVALLVGNGTSSSNLLDGNSHSNTNSNNHHNHNNNNHNNQDVDNNQPYQPYPPPSTAPANMGHPTSTRYTIIPTSSTTTNQPRLLTSSFDVVELVITAIHKSQQA